MPWFPQEKFIWDTWFAWKGEELHAFYLQADREACLHRPDARHDLASVGHAVLSASGWQADGTALAKTEGHHWDNLSIWTGSIIQPEPGRPYFMFYTSRSHEDEPVLTPSEWQRPQQIGVAVSDDLSRWQRTTASETAPIIPNPGKNFGLDGIAWRDPYVIRNNDGLFYAFICARLNQSESGGVVVYVTSPDLNHWSSEPAFVKYRDEFYQMEVPQIFWRNFAGGKRCYLIFCAQEKDCSALRRAQGLECETGTYYLQSDLLPLDSSVIPEFKEPARLLVKNIYAGKLLRPESDEQALFTGFVWADEAGNFVGGISDLQPVHFADDGKITISSSLAKK